MSCLIFVLCAVLRYLVLSSCLLSYLSSLVLFCLVESTHTTKFEPILSLCLCFRTFHSIQSSSLYVRLSVFLPVCFRCESVYLLLSIQTQKRLWARALFFLALITLTPNPKTKTPVSKSLVLPCLDNPNPNPNPNPCFVLSCLLLPCLSLLPLALHSQIQIRYLPFFPPTPTTFYKRQDNTTQDRTRQHKTSQDNKTRHGKTR